MCSSTTYYGQTCYYGCRAKTCEEGGYASSINSCQKASSTNFAGNICYYNIAGKSCGDGGYNASVPANNVCPSTAYCGNTCYYNCRQPQCSEGGYEASIPSGKNCTATSYYGRTCYKDCKNSCNETCNYTETVDRTNQVSGDRTYSCPSCTRCDGSKRYSCYTYCTNGYEKGGKCVNCENYYCIGTGLTGVCQTKCKISCRQTGGWEGDPDC